MGAEKQNVARRIPTDVALVVFGKDRSRKPHASRFGAAAAKSARQAAQAMGMRILPIVTDTQRAIALKLPRGSVSAKGRTVIPMVKPALYEKLLAVAGSDAPATPSTPPGAPLVTDGTKKPTGPGDAKSGTPSDTLGLAKGSVVLANRRSGDRMVACDGPVRRWRVADAAMAASGMEGSAYVHS